MLNSIDILKRVFELQATAMYARGENPTCWRIAEKLGKKELTFHYIEPLLKFWNRIASRCRTARTKCVGDLVAKQLH